MHGAWFIFLLQQQIELYVGRIILAQEKLVVEEPDKFTKTWMKKQSRDQGHGGIPVPNKISIASSVMGWTNTCLCLKHRCKQMLLLSWWNRFKYIDLTVSYIGHHRNQLQSSCDVLVTALLLLVINSCATSSSSLLTFFLRQLRKWNNPTIYTAVFAS